MIGPLTLRVAKAIDEYYQAVGTQMVDQIIAGAKRGNTKVSSS